VEGFLYKCKEVVRPTDHQHSAYCLSVNCCCLFLHRWVASLTFSFRRECLGIYQCRLCGTSSCFRCFELLSDRPVLNQTQLSIKLNSSLTCSLLLYLTSCRYVCSQPFGLQVSALLFWPRH